MSNKTKLGSEQLSLFVDKKSKSVDDPFVGVTLKQSRVNMDAANTSKYKGTVLHTEDEDEQDATKRVFVALATTVRKAEGHLGTAIIKLQADGYSDSLIKAWMIEAGYSDSAAGNKLSQIRIAKGNRQRGTGAGRKVKNVELVDRITEFAALILGEGKYSAKDMESALHAGARLVKEGKVTAVEA